MSVSPAQVCVVLVEPSHPGNVGAVARAMNNMGVSHLRLVNPCAYQVPEALCMASNSESILHQATEFPTLSEAIQDQQLVMGTTARARARHGDIQSVRDLHDLLPSHPCRIALVFGRESSGLTNAELSACNAWLHIPTHGTSASLNLAQAVLLTLYELSQSFTTSGSPTTTASPPLAAAVQVEGVKQHLDELLHEIRFFRSRQEDTLKDSFADLIGRAKLTSLDVRLLRGFFHRIQVTLKRKSTGKE